MKASTYGFHGGLEIGEETECDAAICERGLKRRYPGRISNTSLGPNGVRIYHSSRGPAEGSAG